jgi:hypothetical protein
VWLKNSQNAMEKNKKLVPKVVKKKCGKKKKISPAFNYISCNVSQYSPLPHKTHAIQIHSSLCSNFMVGLGFFHHWT